MRLVLVATLAAFALPAFAQTDMPAPDQGGAPMAGHPAPTPAMISARKAARQACAPDAAKLCADAQAGGGKIMQCLREHRADLSTQCQQSLISLRQARQAGQ